MTQLTMQRLCICTRYVVYCSEESEELAKQLKMRLYKTSVKENINIESGM